MREVGCWLELEVQILPFSSSLIPPLYLGKTTNQPAAADGETSFVILVLPSFSFSFIIPSPIRLPRIFQSTRGIEPPPIARKARLDGLANKGAQSCNFSSPK